MEKGARYHKGLHRLKYAVLRGWQQVTSRRTAEVRPHDCFGRALQGVVRYYKPMRILDIGAWDGTGSTACVLKRINYQPTFLRCVEAVSDEAKKISALVCPFFPFVEVFTGSTICYEQWSYKDFDRDFWTALEEQDRARFNREALYAYWKKERDVLIKQQTPSYFPEQHPAFYDLVIIDGGEFTAVDEFRLLRGRFQIIALDDVFHAFKCSLLYRQLLHDPSFELIAASRFVRRGFAIFARASP